MTSIKLAFCCSSYLPEDFTQSPRYTCPQANFHRIFSEIAAAQPPEEVGILRINIVGATSPSICKGKGKFFINIPYLFFIDPAHIPQEFKDKEGKLRNYEDLEKDHNRHRRLFAWTQVFMGKEKNPDPFDQRAQAELRFFIKLWQQPVENFTHYRQFVYAHEFAHVLCKHCDHHLEAEPFPVIGKKIMNRTLLKHIFMVVSFMVLGGGFGTLYSSNFHFPLTWHSLPFTQGILIGFAFGLLAVLYRCHRHAIKSQQYEYQADKLAAKTPQTLNGGQVFFTLLSEVEDEIESSSKTNCFFKKISDAFSTHPDTRKRLKALQK